MKNFLPSFLLISLTFPPSLLLAESVEDEQGDPYYGVPLGALHYSAEGTSAEVYAADEFSIIFNHFYHNPREQGCTAMMIGPPRMEDKDNVVQGHGILLTMAHPPAAARHKQKRAKRGTTTTRDSRRSNQREQRQQQQQQQKQQEQEQFLGNWPAEFDHLLMEPMPETKTEQKQQQTKEGAVTNRVNVSNTSVTDQLIHTARLLLDNDQQQLSSPTSAFPLSLNGTVSFSPSSNGTVSVPPFVSSSPTSTTTAPSSTTASPTVLTSAASSKGASSSTSLTKQITAIASSPVPSYPSISPKGTPSPFQKNPPIILLPLVFFIFYPFLFVRLFSNKRSKEGHQQQKQTLPKVVTTTEFVGENKGTSESEIRRAPARQSEEKGTRGRGKANGKALEEDEDAVGMDDWVKANELDEKGIPPTLRTAPKLATTTPVATTPLFWVIKDPREARRERLLQLRRKFDPNPEPPTTTTTSAPLLPLSPQFELRRIRDKLVTFSLTNGAKITQYKWIGLWNQCTRRHIPLVSLRDVDPPREEKVMPLSGWSHNVTSYRLHILNCNTILIPSFHYDSRNTTRNTFFFVGIGQFPEAVEQQVKANVVGTRPGEPLRSYKGEDLMLRLPRPYRTFDIDFISIFNVDEQKSFGHVIIPSLLVPPCSDNE